MADLTKIQLPLRVTGGCYRGSEDSETSNCSYMETPIRNLYSIPAPHSSEEAFIQIAAGTETIPSAAPPDVAIRGSILNPPVELRSPLAALRQATANIHGSMHRYPGFTRLMGASLSLTEYSALLARLYGFYFPLESLLREAAPAIISVNPHTREKAHLLHADLISVGLPNSAISKLPMCSAFPPMMSEANIVGCLYVIEGAGRGGSIMARKLDYLLGPTAAGRSFFLGRTAPDPFPWVVFCELLESCARRGNLDEIILSALGTFNAFNLWLNPRGTHE